MFYISLLSEPALPIKTEDLSFESEFDFLSAIDQGELNEVEGFSVGFISSCLSSANFF